MSKRCVVCHVLKWLEKDPEAGAWAALSIGMAPGAIVLVPFATCEEHAKSGTDAVKRADAFIQNELRDLGVARWEGSLDLSDLPKAPTDTKVN